MEYSLLGSFFGVEFLLVVRSGRREKFDISDSGLVGRDVLIVRSVVVGMVCGWRSEYVNIECDIYVNYNNGYR